ncbi:MAG TPA: hypothetical protein VIG04_11800 [Gemmatimonadales bacterium]
MDFDYVLVLGALWFLVNLLTGLKRRSKPDRPEASAPVEPTPSYQPDGTQQEGSKLEQVLREFERALQQRGTSGRPASLPLPDAEEVEERESLETEPEVISLEQEVRRAPRKEFTQDAGAEQLVARRITAASVRDAARTRADHAQFDNQIRKEPAEHTATRKFTAEELRRAVVWREILGPPVSER